MDNESMESRIQQAMRSRVQHFKDQADSLTFEGVRRLLEKDLVLDTYALDAHKRYVEQLLEKYLSGAEDDDKGSEQNKLEKVKEDLEAKNEELPVIGLLSEHESGNLETQDDAKEKIPSADMITEALWKRAAYFRSKSEELTVAGVRRLLEEDLELKKLSLDPFKKLISRQLDEVLNSESDPPSKTGSKSDADSSHSESDNIEAEVKPKKKLAQKGKVQTSQEPKKRKKPVQEIEWVAKKKIKKMSVEKNNLKDDDESESFAEKSVKVQKEVVATVYGKKVERLKSVIKGCGMSVAPTVYKKAKQVPEDKREAFLIKELQEVLSKEGLSANPSEKEIKEVKRRKEKAKELEGIDTSNIVVGSRRRSTFDFMAPPKPKAPVESDDDDDDPDSEDGDGSEDTDGDGDDDGDGDNDGDEDDDVPDEVHEETFDSD